MTSTHDSIESIVNTQDIWLVYLKTRILDPVCTVAFDDSEFLFGVCCVPAVEIHALDRIRKHITKNHMEIIDIFKCLRYNSQEWTDSSNEHKTIRRIAKMARRLDKIHSIYTSEGIEPFTWAPQ